MNINPRNFVAPAHDAGVSDTLTWRLGEMLHEVETQFGPRDPSYALLGIEFTTDGPMTYFPYPQMVRQVIIRLDLIAADDFPRACYQLAHETVHLLAPSANQEANILEEGVAAYYCHEYVKRRFGFEMPSGNVSYDVARVHIEGMLNHNPNIIKELRQQEPNFTKITPELIRSMCPFLAEHTPRFLCKPFHEINGRR